LCVQAVLGLVEHHALRAVHDAVGDLLAAMGGQAVPSASFIETQVSVTTQSASVTAATGSSVSVTSAPFSRAQATVSAGGCKGSGVAMRMRKLKRAAACRKLRATLLPSPTQATVRPAIGPLCCSKVITSAISWHGCDLSVRPLITGTVACSASSLMRRTSPVRIMIAST
jgi:hypothetical protein